MLHYVHQLYVLSLSVSCVVLGGECTEGLSQQTAACCSWKAATRALRLNQNSDTAKWRDIIVVTNDLFHIAHSHVTSC